MNKPKIRLLAYRLRINGVNRYQVVDHRGVRWTHHHEDRMNNYHDVYGSEYWVTAPHNDNDIVIDNEDKLKYVLNITGGSAGEALERHAPLSKHYEILSPDTVITRIRIVKPDDKRGDPYYCLESSPFEDQAARQSEFYTIDELSGRRILIRYSMIMEIQYDTI